MTTKLFFALTCLLFTLPVFAQGKCDYTMNVDAHAMFNKDTGQLIFVDANKQLISGKMCGYDGNKLVEETSSKSGKIDGIRKGYYDNGKLKFEAAFSNGTPEGLSKYYFDNGKPDKEFIYTKGKVISGKCANGYKWTDAEIAKWNGSNAERDSVRNICK